jgi:5'(3')-deoxyribonucleotidase
VRILIDLDGTVCDTLPDWLDCIFQRTGIRAWAHQITEWEMKQNSALSMLTDAELYAPLHEPGFFANVRPLQGAIDGVEALRVAGHSIYFVTARCHPVSFHDTRIWLKRYFPWVDEERHLILAYDKEVIYGDVLIDDKPKTLLSYVNAWPHALCIAPEHPYNNFIKHPKVTVARSWRSIIDVIRAHNETCRQ